MKNDFPGFSLVLSGYYRFMRVRDDRMWAEQDSELVRSGDQGVKFRDVLVAWIDLAEGFMSEDDRLGVRDCFLAGFESIEKVHGFLSLEWLGQMLLLTIQHWEHGDSLLASLSPWEMRLVEQPLALKLAELSIQAGQGD